MVQMCTTVLYGTSLKISANDSTGITYPLQNSSKHLSKPKLSSGIHSVSNTLKIEYLHLMLFYSRNYRHIFSPIDEYIVYLIS